MGGWGFDEWFLGGLGGGKVGMLSGLVMFLPQGCVEHR